MMAYLSYIIVYDAKSPPIIDVIEMKNESYARSVGEGLQQMLTELSKTRDPITFMWCVTTSGPLGKIDLNPE